MGRGDFLHCLCPEHAVLFELDFGSGYSDNGYAQLYFSFVQDLRADYGGWSVVAEEYACYESVGEDVRVSSSGGIWVCDLTAGGRRRVCGDKKTGGQDCNYDGGDGRGP